MLTRLLLLALLACLMVIGVFGWALRESWAREDARHDASGFQAANPRLGLAASQQVPRKAVDAEYADKVKAGAVPDARPFLKEHGARVDAVLSANGEQAQVVDGVAKVGLGKAGQKLTGLFQSGPVGLGIGGQKLISPSPSGWPADGGNRLRNIPGIIPEANQGVACYTDRVASAFGCPKAEVGPLSYDWHSLDGRFHLHDSDISHPAPVFTADQHYRLTAVLIRQTSGPLRTAQLALQEVDASGKVLGDAKLTDVHLDYAPEPPPPLWNPRLIVELGILTAPRLPLSASPSLGVGASLLQLGDFNAQVTAFVGLSRLEDSGGAVALSWRPTIWGRQMNIGLSAGVGVTVLGVVAPRVAIVDWVW